MSAKLKTYADEFKAKVVLETLREEQTVNEIASKRRVVPRSIHNWKRLFLENMHYVFHPDKAAQIYKDRCRAQQEEIDELHRQIGELSAQLVWAKKKSREAGLDRQKTDD